MVFRLSRFEVTWQAGLMHRGSPNMDDKLIGKAKRGEVVVGTPTPDGMWLVCENDIYIPIKSAKGKSLMKCLNEPLGSMGPVGGGFNGGPMGISGSSIGSSSGMSIGSSAPPKPINELDALHAMGDSKFGRKKAPPMQLEVSGNSNSVATNRNIVPNQSSGSDLQNRVHAAIKNGGSLSSANSHVANNRYMEEFEIGLREMGVQDTHLDPFLHVQPKKFENPELGQEFRRNSADSASKNNDASNVNDIMDCPKNSAFRTYGQSVKHGVETVHESAGQAIDLSDRNILCMDVNADGTRVVCGSADHALKEVDLNSGRVVRTLYSERAGHTDWVTSVAYLPDGRVLSASADSKLCLWQAGGRPVCNDLKGHMTSISKVDVSNNVAISSSYDKSLRLWDLRSKRETSVLVAHPAPVLTFSWKADRLVSGDRSGNIFLWDVARGEKIAPLKGHKGHITAIQHGEEGDGNIFFTGAQDGHIRLWDARVRKNLRNWPAHIGGAVNDVHVVGDIMTSIGADNRLVWTDLRAARTTAGSGFESDCVSDFLNVVENVSQDFVYCMYGTGRQVFLGDGHGNLSAYDILTCQLSWNFKACVNAIRCLKACVNPSNTQIICAGDDGNLQIFRQ